jgi:hypothetical protein
MAEENALDKANKKVDNANRTLDKAERLDNNVNKAGKTFGKLFKK